MREQYVVLVLNNPFQSEANSITFLLGYYESQVLAPVSYCPPTWSVAMVVHEYQWQYSVIRFHRMRSLSSTNQIDQGRKSAATEQYFNVFERRHSMLYQLCAWYS